MRGQIKVNYRDVPEKLPNFFLWGSDVELFLDKLPQQPIFDLVVTSPPYNLGKEYEERQDLAKYIEWQKRIIQKTHAHLKDTGSICWQVGNFVDNGHVQPLDIELAPIFKELGMKLRNRIVWRFGHGLHCENRFSGRYEVILWYTKTDNYKFHLDRVRVPQKYPNKKHFKGPKKGELSGNPLGKNPEDVWEADDVWDIPNVKSNHVEKTEHPCQFPVGLAERLVLALSDPGDVVFDPFMGVASTGVAAALRKRHFAGCETMGQYVKVGQQRIQRAIDGELDTRPHDKPIYIPSIRESTLQKKAP